MAEAPAVTDRGAASARPFGTFERMVASRYLRAPRQDAFVSVIALISFIGITLGVTTLIIVLAVMNGFREDLMSRILGVNGHLSIQSSEDTVPDAGALADRISQIAGVRLVVPLVAGEVLASGPAGGGQGARVRGMSSAGLSRLDAIAGNVTAGTLDGFDESGSVAVGASLATTLGLPIYEMVTLVSPSGEETAYGINPEIQAFPVGALIATGQQEFDLSAILMPFDDAARFFGVDGPTDIDIYLDDPQAVDAFLPQLTPLLGDGLSVTDWRVANSSLFDALQIERNVMFMVLGLILIVAALNIVSGLVMLVKDKGSDIGILRSMGTSRAGVLRVFIMTGSAIGVSGTLAGFVLGTLFALNIEVVSSIFGAIGGPESMLSQFLSRLPASLDFGETVSVLVMALALTLIASAFPAWRAATLDPVQALRGA